MKDENKKEYEIAYLLATPEAEQDVLALLKQNGAEISHQKAAASIPLAYPIKKHATAYFGFVYFMADPAVIKPVTDALTLQKGVLRSLVITPPVRVAAPMVPGTGRPEKKVTPSISNEALEEKLEEILK
ncbi:MAG: 30S ribosomal protein S6 [Parcubacteria group bacterium Gr01-1014_19]|nr:MAG: 30S ribosomal protein S6 [Parcubacteria group bacterium Gr01-1014_19]